MLKLHPQASKKIMRGAAISHALDGKVKSVRTNNSNVVIYTQENAKYPDEFGDTRQDSPLLVHKETLSLPEVPGQKASAGAVDPKASLSDTLSSLVVTKS